METKTDSLTFRHRLGYALGDFGGCMTFAIMTSFMTRYYVNVLYLDTAVVALMTLIWKIFDGVGNPIIGVVMDRAIAKSSREAGAFRPWILRMIPPVAFSAILVFTAPGWVSGFARLAVAFLTYLFYELFYGMHHIALGGLLSAMAVNDDERAQLSSARGIGGMLGYILPTMLFPVILTAFAADGQLGFGVGITICAALGILSCLLCYRFTRERSTGSRQETPPIQVTDIFEVCRKNRAFVALGIHGLLQGILMSVNGTLGTYMYADVLGSLSLMSIGSLAGIPLNILFMSVVPRLSRRFGAQKVLRASLLLGCGLYVALFALHVLTPIPVWLHIGLNALASGIAGLSSMMQWGMLGEAIEYNEYLTGKRTEGSINGTFNMLRRLGQGLGGSIGVAVLGLIGYNAAAAVQTGATVFGIKALCLLFPAACALGGWLVFRCIWNITPEVKADIARWKQTR